ncbi:C4b-binding protein alpha chain-like [Nycticebus coucang]|uniref:C4b-binding protein alpha chain-like n=1 Tax=Nycticebus coucang TaxID=9470 RepID=UPI00234C7257|nr:C4b-binding protein alpha chain-like [Nycticebus coucang]
MHQRPEKVTSYVDNSWSTVTEQADTNTMQWEDIEIELEIASSHQQLYLTEELFLWVHKWHLPSSPDPWCVKESCTDLPVIPHAFWEVQPTEKGYPVGTVLKYRCLPGYKALENEPTTVTCQENLRWTPYKVCKELCCPIPELNDGEITHHRKSRRSTDCVYFYGDEVSYLCSWAQEHSATCQSDGTWSPHTPSCGCNIPPTIAHGHHKGVRSSSLKHETTYECDEGFTLVGQAKLSCRSSRWSPSPPQCKAVCMKPEIVNGRLSVDKDQYVEPENITIHCHSGYSRVGPESIICLENRTWYPGVPMCEWDAAQICEKVRAGREVMQCLPRQEDVKAAQEAYKLSVEIALLEILREKARQATPDKEL